MGGSWLIDVGRVGLLYILATIHSKEDSIRLSSYLFRGIYHFLIPNKYIDQQLLLWSAEEEGSNRKATQ